MIHEHLYFELLEIWILVDHTKSLARGSDKPLLRGRCLVCFSDSFVHVDQSEAGFI